MAPRDDNAANELVRENFGLTADDLGMNKGEDSFFTDDDDDLPKEMNGNEPGSDDPGHDDNVPGDEPDPLFEEPPQPQQQQQRPQPQAPKPQKGIPQMAEVRPDGKGNLIDKATGKIVARAGSEARMYQKMHNTVKAYQHLEHTQRDTQSRLEKAIQLGTEMFNRIKTLQENQAATSPSKYGLNDMEAIEALNFAKEAKTDPVGTIKKLLTKAASSGIDLTSIGLSGGNFDPKSLMDLVRGEIGKAMNPLHERSQRETAQEQQQREAKEREDQANRDLTDFLGANPDARQFLPVFHQVYSQPQFQHMSLGEVWSRIQLNLLKNQQRPVNQQRGRQPVPSGRRGVPGGQAPKGDLAPVSDSYEDIVGDILKRSV